MSDFDNLINALCDSLTPESISFMQEFPQYIKSPLLRELYKDSIDLSFYMLNKTLLKHKGCKNDN